MRADRILVAVLVLAVSACAEETLTEPDITPTEQQDLISRETAKWDLFFGSPEDRQVVLRAFADDFTSVQYGPTGVTRVSKAEMAQGLSFFPQLPKGTFQASDMRVIRTGDLSVILSYRISGPGPTGQEWSAYASSTWSRRAGEWKTVFYQATAMQ